MLEGLDEKKLKIKSRVCIPCKPCSKPNKMNRKYSSGETLRSTSFSMIKPLIDNEYEDACYELAYNLDASLMISLNENGIKNCTQIVKSLLKNKKLYEMLHNYNEHIKILREFNRKQIALHLIEYVNKMDEATTLLVEANKLKMRFHLI